MANQSKSTGILPLAMAAMFLLASVLPGLVRGQGVLQPQRANKLDVAAYAGVIYSDNEDHTSGRPGTSVVAGTVLSLFQQTGKLHTDVSGDIRYRRFRNDISGSPLEGTLRGRIAYAISPERLTWIVEENFGQAFVDQRQLYGPGNRQRVNYLSTGPDVSFPLSDLYALIGSARWADARYGRTDQLDNHRYLISTGVSRKLGVHSLMSVEGSVQKVTYQLPASTVDHKTRTMFLHFEGSGLKTWLSARLGQTRLEQNGAEQREPNLNIALLRRMTAYSSLKFEGGQGVSDQEESFRRDQLFTDASAYQAPSAVVAGAQRNQYASATFSLRGLRDSLDLSMIWQRDKYFSGTVPDKTRTGPQLQLSRQVTPVLALGAHVARWEDKYARSSPSVFENDFGLSAGWVIRRGLAMSLLIDRFSGAGQPSSNSVPANYTENRVTLNLSYHPVR